jgi:hypothetical protein
MERLINFLCELGETDAQPLVNCVVVMLMVFGLLTCAKLYAASLPFHYTVQCQAPTNPQSRLALSSRISGLTTEGPTADAKGVAAVTSENDSEHYDISLEGSPCRRVENLR